MNLPEELKDDFDSTLRDAVDASIEASLVRCTLLNIYIYISDFNTLS